MVECAVPPYMLVMDLASQWQSLVDFIAQLPRSGLLIATVAAVVIGFAGSQIARRAPGTGQWMRRLSTAALLGVLVLVVLQLSRFDPRLEIAVPQLGLPEQVVSGNETRIPLASDGHFWVRAEVNGVAGNFMIDTGATLTALSADFAEQADLQPRRGGLPVELKTANGTVMAQLTNIETMRFGNIDASGLDAVIAPNLEDVNVVGMNFLSRLNSWRVEENTLILEPAEDQRAFTAG